MSATDEIFDDAGVPRPTKGIATRVLKIMRDAGLTMFRDQDNVPYVANGREVIPFMGGGVRALLGRLFYQAESHVASRHVLDDAAGVLQAEALYGDRVEPVYLRVAPLPDGVTIDLGSPDWTAAVVKAGSWAVEPHPVRFRRPPTLGSLPVPVRGGDLASLRRFLNVASEDNWRLIVGFLLAALRPVGPFAALGLSGQQGSAKSFTAKLLKRLIDPTTDGNGLRSLTRNEAGFWTAAAHSWLPAFDNLSGITAEQSDWLSQLATGGGRTAKRLYTDGDEFVQGACRPVILNGIELGDRPDLASRTIHLELAPISDATGFTVEERLIGEFEREHPALLGALLDGLAEIVARIDSVPETGWQARMADHVRWVTAAEASLGWESGSYEALFVRAQEEELAALAEGVVWLPHLVQLINDNGGAYEVSASDLLAGLLDGAEASPRDIGWPRTARGMTNALSRHASSLRATGIKHTTVPDRHLKTNRHRFELAGVAGDAGVETPSVPGDEEVETGTDDVGPGTETTPATPAAPAVPVWPWATSYTYDVGLDLDPTSAAPCSPDVYRLHASGVTRAKDGSGWQCAAGCQRPS